MNNENKKMHKNRRKNLLAFINKNKYTILYVVAIVVYAVFSFVLMITHENGCNEAQAWLISKDLNFWGIYKQMYWEGHPCLWHWMLMPLAQLGFPYHSMNFVSWGICLISVILILKKSPLHPIVNVILIFSMPSLYNYSALSRNYCLIPLALTLLAINYKSRHEHPIRHFALILFLAWTHVIMWGMVGGLIIVYCYEELIDRDDDLTPKEKKAFWTGMLLLVVGLIILLVPIGLGVSHNYLVREGLNWDDFYILNFMSDLIFAVVSKYYVALLLFLFVSFLLYEYFYHRKGFVIAAFTFGFWLYMYYYVYYVSDQRMESLVFILMFICWINTYEQKRKTAFYKKLTRGLAVCGLALILIELYNNHLPIVDITMKSSDGYGTANYIANNIEDDTEIVVINSSYVASVIAEIPDNHHYKFYDVVNGQYFSYVEWYGENGNVLWPEMKKILYEDFQDEKQVHVLCFQSCDYIFIDADDNIEIENLYSTDMAMHEGYNLILVTKKDFVD